LPLEFILSLSVFLSFSQPADPHVAAEMERRPEGRRNR
jgi:hypothetical protein